MSNFRAAYRYALAVIGIAEERKQLDAVSKDFLLMDALIRQSQEFSLFLKSPIINTEKKKLVLDEIFKNKVSEITYLFLKLIASKGREDILPEIIEQFNKLYDNRLGMLNAKVVSAIAMNDEQQTLLADQLKKLTGKNIRLSMEQDASIIGGLTLQYDDTVIDGSVKHQLELLSKQFAANVV